MTDIRTVISAGLPGQPPEVDVWYDLRVYGEPYPQPSEADALGVDGLRRGSYLFAPGGASCAGPSREATRCGRAALRRAGKAAAVPYVRQVPGRLAPWVPADRSVLGTDGFALPDRPAGPLPRGRARGRRHVSNGHRIRRQA